MSLFHCVLKFYLTGLCSVGRDQGHIQFALMSEVPTVQVDYESKTYSVHNSGKRIQYGGYLERRANCSGFIGLQIAYVLNFSIGSNDNITQTCTNLGSEEIQKRNRKSILICTFCNGLFIYTLKCAK